MFFFVHLAPVKTYVCINPHSSNNALYYFIWIIRFKNWNCFEEIIITESEARIELNEMKIDKPFAEIAALISGIHGVKITILKWISFELVPDAQIVSSLGGHYNRSDVDQNIKNPTCHWCVCVFLLVWSCLQKFIPKVMHAWNVLSVDLISFGAADK